MQAAEPVTTPPVEGPARHRVDPAVPSTPGPTAPAPGGPAPTDPVLPAAAAATPATPVPAAATAHAPAPAPVETPAVTAAVVATAVAVAVPGGSGGPAADDQPDDRGSDPSTATVGGTPAAPATPAPAASSSAPVPAPRADAPPVAAQLTPQLLDLTSTDGTHTVTVVLAPESLGEVRVQLVVTGDQVQLTLASGQEHGRAALAEALPDLRRDLATAGLTVTTADVTGSTTGGPQTGSGWGGRPDGTDRWASRVPTGVPTADDDSGTTRTTGHTRDRSAAAGVDVRV